MVAARAGRPAREKAMLISKRDRSAGSSMASVAAMDGNALNDTERIIRDTIRAELFHRRGREREAGTHVEG
jgi:hypothetical protein